jgi:hypothetical protein
VAPAERAAAAAAAAPDGSGYAEFTSATAEQSDASEFGNSGGIMAHDIIFLLGDLNYRLAGDKADVEALVAAGDWVSLQSRDQVCSTDSGDVFDLTIRSCCSRCQ